MPRLVAALDKIRRSESPIRVTDEVAQMFAALAPLAAEPADWYLGGSVVYTDDDPERRLDDVIGGGQIHVGRYLTDVFALEAHLGYPATDPHGDPIPSKVSDLEDELHTALCDWETGRPARIDEAAAFAAAQAEADKAQAGINAIAQQVRHALFHGVKGLDDVIVHVDPDDHETS